MKLVSGGRSTSDCVKLLVFGLISLSIELLFSGCSLPSKGVAVFGFSISSIELLFSATSIAGFAMLRSFGDNSSLIELLFSDWCTSRNFSEEPV